MSSKFARIIHGFPTKCRLMILEKSLPLFQLAKRVPRPTKPSKLSRALSFGSPGLLLFGKHGLLLGNRLCFKSAA